MSDWYLSSFGMRASSGIAAILVCGFLAACTAPAQIQKVQEQEARIIKLGDTSKPIQFRKIVVRMPRNQVVGAVQINPLCMGETELTYRGGRVSIEDEAYSDVFREELENANYVVVGDPDALFEDVDSWKAELLIAGLIKDIKANICYPNTSFGDMKSSKGEAYMAVEWQVYSRLSREVVYTVTTEGAGEILSARLGGGEDGIVEAFAQATRNPLADEGFYNLVTSQPALAGGATQIPDVETAIALVPQRTESFQETVTETRAKVVSIFAGDGLGSGFFIADNMVMTNQHVVGGASLVVVRTVTGRELVGEVIATNAGRDVALVRTESVGLGGLPINRNDSPVGSQVFVIGSPLQEENESTVSSGIISAYRTEDELRYIQSDVNVLGGNSGGPMFDDRGNVIGITVQGTVINNVSVGLNRFIPIGDALSALNVRIKGDAS